MSPVAPGEPACGPLRRVVIVGGGTAGWMSAAHLQRTFGLASPDERVPVAITVIESSRTNPVGVGEATVPTLIDTFRYIGLPEREWMAAVGGSFKTGIRFDDWRAPDRERGTPHRYWHPFPKRPDVCVYPTGERHFPTIGEGFSLTHYWHRRHLLGDPTPYAYACFEGPWLCDAMRAPCTMAGEHVIRTAYHFDAGRVAGHLREHAVARGVVHRIGHVAGVELDAQGFIAAVVLDDGERVAGDLFIDCSGFAALLIEGALGEPFVEERASLLCDSAVAMSVRNHPERDGIPPYTTATARDAGWTWDIPLLERRGCGYVFASAFASPDEAEAEARAAFGPDADGMDSRLIRMRVGRRRESWVRNCVAIGLSSAFLEPLESTGIFLIEFQLAALVPLLPDRGFSASLRRRYNEVLRSCYEQTRDFIVLHYILSDRRDTPFWRAVAADTVIPDSLAAKLEFFAEHLPVLTSELFTVFTDRSFTAILAGMGALPPRSFPVIEHAAPRLGDAMLAELRARADHLVQTLPDHYAYLRSLREPHASASEPGSSEAP
jgi:Tryptophan halogenase